MQHRAFSLIELMVVLLIVGITSAVAYPSYRHHLQTSRRAQAKAQLYQYAHELEKYFSLHHTYQGAAPPSNSAHYRFKLTLPDINSYVISATPIEYQRNDRCSTLSLNNKGENDPSHKHC